jgi:hypothetical protein
MASKNLIERCPESQQRIIPGSMLREDRPEAAEPDIFNVDQEFM